LAGEVASQLAVNTVGRLMRKYQESPDHIQWAFSERFRLAIEQANLFILEQSQSSSRLAGMGATFTGAAIQDGVLYLAQVGDSRAYLVRGGRIRQATKDQSLVGQLVDAGYITEEQAQEHVYRNVILQALGAHSDTTVVLDSVELLQGDIIFLCSDGLSNKVQAEEILNALSSGPDLAQACTQLVDLANERGGEDNITVVAGRFLGDGLRDDPGDTDYSLVRIDRDENLPSALNIDPEDREHVLTHSLSEVPTLTLVVGGNEGLANTGGANGKNLTPDDLSPPTESPPDPALTGFLERNISRILVIVLALLFLGALVASMWYIEIRDQNVPAAEKAGPESVSGPPMIGLGAM
jgi:serine/threonine protein phosphatase PrpC